MLGRYMDPYGCQAHIRGQRKLWEKWYTQFFIIAAGALIFGPETDFLSLAFLAVPWAIVYFYVKSRRRRQYDLYYAVQEEILRTGEPQWVPYDKVRLHMIDRNPLAVWP
jgi:hypothetical protein